MNTRPKYIAALALALMLLGASQCSQADEQYTDDQRAALILFSTCAAANAIVAGQVDHPAAQAMLTEVGTWYASPVPDGIVDAALEQVQAEYNAGQVEWPEIVDFAANCENDREDAKAYWLRVFP